MAACAVAHCCGACTPVLASLPTAWDPVHGMLPEPGCHEVSMDVSCNRGWKVAAHHGSTASGQLQPSEVILLNSLRRLLAVVPQVLPLTASADQAWLLRPLNEIPTPTPDHCRLTPLPVRATWQVGSLCCQVAAILPCSGTDGTSRGGKPASNHAVHAWLDLAACKSIQGDPTPEVFVTSWACRRSTSSAGGQAGPLPLWAWPLPEGPTHPQGLHLRLQVCWNCIWPICCRHSCLCTCVLPKNSMCLATTLI